MRCTEKPLNVGSANDFDVEDADDTLAWLKAAAWLRKYKDQHVILHLILDCGARVDYFFKVLGFLLEDGRIIGSNACIRIYLAEPRDELRKSEVTSQMQTAHNVPAEEDFDIHKTRHDVLSIDSFPWEELDVFLVQAPQYSIPMQRVAEMPPTSKVWYVGDDDSVNNRGFPHSELKVACKRNCEGQSRYIGNPPRDKNGNSGMTRQCLTPFAIIDLFCLLSKSEDGDIFKDLVRAFAESVRRTIFDRPDNSRNETITAEHIGKNLDISGTDVHLDGTELKVHWGTVKPQDISGVITAVNEHTGEIKVSVQPATVGRMASIATDVEQAIQRPECINRRRRITLSNRISNEAYVAQVVSKVDAAKPADATKLLVTVDDKLEGSWSVADLDKLASHVLKWTMDSQQVLVARGDNPEQKVNISNRLQVYSSTYMGHTVTGFNQTDHSRETNDEWSAILYCTLASVFLFGNALCPTRPIAMAADRHEAVMATIIDGFGGKLDYTTPNYDGAVMDMALHSLLEGDVDLLVDKCEDGHCVVGNQTEETIEAYRKRDREHIDDIKVSAAQHVKRQRLARSSDT